MFTFDYIDSLAECWTRDRLSEAAKLWPESANWQWFCGARLADHDATRQIEVLSVAIAHATKQRYRLRQRPGELYEWAKTAPMQQRLARMAELGAELDQLDAAKAALQPAAAVESE